MNRMTSVTGLDGEVTTYAYDAAGRRVETASRTLTTKYAYDTVGNLLTQVTTGETEIAYAYSYNRNGYITGEERTADGQTITSAFAYDALGQLTGFEQSTGYSESYAYDKVGNMTRKVISGMDGETVALSMRYNKGNQLTSMTNGKDKIAYKYDKNGSMVEKVLTSKQYGKLTDTYAYNALDQLVSCTGYDGYKQVLTYDANGMRLSKSEYGNADRSTLDELLRGNVAGLPEVIQPAEDVPEEYAWATTEYLYDITAEYYQVIQKNTADATTTYEYGLERIAAYSGNGKQSYAYDGRGSVAMPTGYTPFGEQMGGLKVEGYGYNAEDYDAATGMLNLRARQYEPAINRFSQRDTYPSSMVLPSSMNVYLFCYNDSVNMFDANGCIAKTIGSLITAATSLVKQAINSIAVSYLTSVKEQIKGLAAAANNGYAAAKSSNDQNVRTAYDKATQAIKEKEEKRILSEDEKNKLFASTCMLTSMKIAEMYGANASKEFTLEETLGVYSSMIAQNPETPKSERMKANDLLKDYGFSKAPYDPKMVCVPYVCNAYQNSELFEKLKGLTQYKKIVRLTTPLYSALAGGDSREYGNVTSSDYPNEYVKAVISIGNTEEAPKIKLAGDTEYITLYDASIINFTTKEQTDILLEAQITQPLDIMFFGGRSYKQDGKTIRNTNALYNPDINQIHVVLFDSPLTYSGMGAESGSGKSNVQKNKEINPEKKYTIDVILMNHNPQSIRNVVNMLGGNE